MEARNPYAPPKAEVGGNIRNMRCTRDRSSVVVQIGSDLPARCIVCNAPATAPVKEIKLYWHSPWFYLLILINILVYLVVGLLARKSVKVSPGLCATHTSKRRRRVFGFLGAGSAAATGAVFLLLASESGAATALFVIALLLFVVGAFASRKVYAKKITKEYALLGGCKEPFLASLE